MVPGSEGTLNSVSVGFRLGPFAPIEISRGVRNEKHNIDPLLGERLTWTGVDLSVSLGRHWYMNVSAEANRGRSEDHETIYSGTYYRF